jgi:glyoxylase-like metal-dependent hydrolase (beta-lactamase superfamily II)
MLVDTGMDGDATALLAELARRGLDADDVHTVLLTHGHVDHTSGAVQFPGARYLIGEADVPLAMAQRETTSLAGRLFSKLLTPTPLPKPPEAVHDGFTEVIDHVPVRAISVPGHTPGSVAWVVGRTLFSGDAALHLDDTIGPSPWFVDEDHDLAIASIARLDGLDVDVMADGHVGKTTEPEARIEAFLASGR